MPQSKVLIVEDDEGCLLYTSDAADEKEGLKPGSHS